MISHYSGIYSSKNNISDISQINNSKIQQQHQMNNNNYTDKDYYLETSSKVDVSMISSSKNNVSNSNNNAFAIKHMSFSNLGQEID